METDEVVSNIAPIDPLAFHGPCGAYVRALAPQTEADQPAVLVQMLIMVGNMIGRSAYYSLGNTKHYPNLFAVIIGNTNESRKGTSFQEARAPFSGIDGRWCTDCIAGNLSTGEGLVNRIRDAAYKPQKTQDKTGRFTYGQELVDPGVSDKRLLDFEAEFSSMLKMFAREGNNLCENVRKAFDAVLPLEFNPKNLPIRATGAHVSIVGHITPDELLAYLTETEVANGLMNRFLLIYSVRTRYLAFGGKAIPQKLLAFQRACRAAAGNLTKDVQLVFSPDARLAYEKLYGKGNVSGPLNFNRPGLFGALIARAAPFVLRPSLIYAALDCSSRIELPHLAGALAVVDYSVRSVHKIFGEKTGAAAADTIMDALRQSDGITRTDISNLFGRNIPQGRLQAALDILSSQGLAAVSQKSQSFGRPAEIWKAMDKVGPSPTPDYLALFRSKEWKAKLRRSQVELKKTRDAVIEKLGRERPARSKFKP